jgi:hypothetical protein
MRENRLREFPNPENAFLDLIQRKNWVFENAKTQFFPESRKHFLGSGIRVIDSPHKITPRVVIFRTIHCRVPKSTFLAHPVTLLG